MSSRVWPLLAVLALAACDHTPTGSWSLPERQPLTSSNPRLLTYNPGWDTKPVWLPDGSGFFYTLERTGQDADQCLGLMPSAGGGVTAEVCDHRLGGEDSVSTLQSAAARADGRLAYVWSTARRGAPSPARQEIRLTTRAQPNVATAARTLPYLAPSGNVHLDADHLQWLAPGKLLYLGMRVAHVFPCQFCPLDTLYAGVEAVELDVPSGGVTVVPGTAQATSLAAAGADTLYYTLAGDSRVWRRVLSTGVVTVAHDFGATTIPRDVAVAGTRLVAVIGGRIRTEVPDTTMPPMQINEGGELWQVDLGTGMAVPVFGVVPPLWFRRPALSPDGRRLVAEGYGLNIAGPDTTAVVPGDLWLVDLP